ncbi:hypothetical protein KFU94_60570 [Chloroflexi bacterium TSY]|nr:hypothetical protein [Chloroflexi bacterium TSY]
MTTETSAVGKCLFTLFVANDDPNSAPFNDCVKQFPALFGDIKEIVGGTKPARKTREERIATAKERTNTLKRIAAAQDQADTLKRLDGALSFEDILQNLEQFDFYYHIDQVSETDADGVQKAKWFITRLVFVGIIKGHDMMTLDEDNLPCLARESGSEKPVFNERLVRAIRESLVLNDPKLKCTWIVVPLNELDNGRGTLLVDGMAGITGAD